MPCYICAYPTQARVQRMTWGFHCCENCQRLYHIAPLEKTLKPLDFSTVEFGLPQGEGFSL